MNRPRLAVVAASVIVVTPGLLVLVSNHVQPASGNSLKFSELEVRVGGAGSDSDSVPVAVALHNQGEKDVELISVISPCTCVTTAPVDGLTVRAHSSVDLRFRVSLPAAGSRASMVAVHFDGQRAPLELRVIATGRRELPLLRTVRNPRITFLALKSPAESFDDLVIETREQQGSPAWIVGLSCDLPQVRIEARGVRDDAHAANTFVDRSYLFSVSWNDLPETPQFSGLLQAMTRDRQQFVIGRVIGSLASNIVLSPAIVELKPPAVVSETVFIDSRSGDWGLAPDADVPDWLYLEWTTTPRGPALIVAIPNAVPDKAPRVTLPLSSRDGLRAALDVVIRPSEPR